MVCYLLLGLTQQFVVMHFMYSLVLFLCFDSVGFIAILIIFDFSLMLERLRTSDLIEAS